MDLKEMEWEGVDLDGDQCLTLVNTVINLQVV
jgi:hypothetical protein